MAFTENSFNTMIKLRNGNLPVNIVVINCNDKDQARAWVENNEALNCIPEYGFYETDKVVDGQIVFTTAPTTKPHFEVILETKNSNLQKFVDGVMLDELDYEMVEAIADPTGLGEYIKTEEGLREAITKTVEAHYANAVDNVFTMHDLDWLKESNDHSNEVVANETHVDETLAQNTETVTNEEAVAPVVSDPEPMNDLPAQNEPTETVSEPVQESNIPTPPAVETINANQGVEELSAEEIAENEELLTKIRAAYEECFTVVEKSCNSLFLPIKNEIKKSLEQNSYTSQLCLMYLEVSNDISTMVYKKLYETDNITKEFNARVHRQTLYMGCPGCNHSWYEDITFLEKGVHEIFCPKCNMSRVIEKK